MESLNYLVDASLVIEKLRVASAVGLAHLARNKRADPDREELHKRLVDLEEFVDGKVAVRIKEHPAYPWFSKVKGVGKENIGKVVGGVRVKPATKEVIWCSSCEEEVRGGELKKCPKCDSKLIFKVIDLPYADSVSALRMFAGFAPVDGHSMKRTKGEKLKYNSQLRSMCWRLASSLLRAKGKFYDYYLKEKEKYQERYRNEGKAIVPVTSLPKKDKKRYEPENMISEGHVHNQALRKMIQLFLACLWLTWREAEGLPATKPYAIDQLKHDSFIDPWKMLDR